jgi:CubicO group peptidase (beta-lactamase class C family)
VSDYPSGLLRMSAHSLSIYLQSFLNNFSSLLSNLSSFEEMIRVPTDYNSEVQFGLIWHWRNFKGKRFIGHRGAMPGITNLMMVNEKRSLGVILLSNGDITKDDNSSIKVYETLTNLLTQLFDCFE